MKKIIYLLCCFAFSIFVGCMKMPSAKINTTSIEITRPGDRLGLVEVQALKIDSIFGYPSEVKELIAFTIVERKTHKRVDPNAVIKMDFGIKNEKYCWQVRPDLFSADVYYKDTIEVKPNTWYRLSTEKYHFTVYYFFNKEKGEYITKFKPDPGAW